MTEVSSSSSLTGPIPPHSKSAQEQQSQHPQHLPGGDNEGAGSEIRCICGFEDDDGFTIQCDMCDRWQHGVCFRISEKDVPDIWRCHMCNPERFQDADKKRAYEKQKKRREQESRNHQRKKGSGTSNRKKEAGSNGHHQRNDSETSYIQDKTTDRKPSSPKDKDGQPTSKSRRKPLAAVGNLQHQTAVNGNNTVASNGASVNNFGTNVDLGVGSNHNSPVVHSPGLDDEFDSDSEIPASVYNREYNLITSNSILSQDVKSNLTSSARRMVPTELSFARDDFNRIFNQKRFKVRRASGSERSPAAASPQMYVTVEEASDVNQFVLEFRGEIGLQQDYTADTINQYLMIHHPKPFVLFHPQLPLYIDARRCGSESRFIRRSCKPNLELKTILVDDHEVKFCLFTRSSLGPGAELTLGWEWDPTTLLARFSSGNLHPEPNSSENSKLAAEADSILSQFGGCACADKKDCVFEKLTDQTVTKLPTKNYSRRKRPAESAGTISSITVKEPTPERLTNGHGEDSRKRRSSSLSSRGNSGSRDRTPCYPMYDAPPLSASALEAESSREARKMKEAMILFEKLENKDGQQRAKRVKRPVSNKYASTGADTVGRMLEDSNDDKNNARSTVSPPLSSPIRLKNNQRNIPRVTYAEASTQTEPLVFDCGSRKPLPPRRSASKKQRILAMFRRERMQIGLVKEEPTTLPGTSDDVPMFDPGSGNVTDDVKSEILADSAVIQSDVPEPDKMAVDPPTQQEFDSGTIHVVDPSLKSPPLTSNADTGEEATSPITPVNGFRAADINPEIPRGPMFPNAPTTPALISAGVRPDDSMTQTPLTQSPPPLSSGLVIQQPPEHTLSGFSAATTISTPGKKKLSLSEYGKRRKAGEISDKEKLAIPVVPNVPQSPSIPMLSSSTATASDMNPSTAATVPNDTLMMDVDVKTEIA